jgi:hypothetical protein
MLVATMPLLQKCLPLYLHAAQRHQPAQLRLDNKELAVQPGNT